MLWKRLRMQFGITVRGRKELFAARKGKNLKGGLLQARCQDFGTSRPTGTPRQATFERPGAICGQRIEGKGGIVFIKDRKTPSMQRSAHDSRLYFILSLLFCDFPDASEFIRFAGHLCL